MDGSPFRHVRPAKQGDVLVLEILTPELHGDLIEQELRDEMLSAWQNSAAQHVVLDFGQVRYLTSAVLRALIALQRAVKSGGGQALMCNVTNENVQQVLTTTRIITSSGTPPYLFEFAPDVASALARLANGPTPANPPANPGPS
jgi:anti-anti-sigma factor